MVKNNDSHSELDKEKLQQEMDSKVRNLLQTGDAFDDLVKHFLDGFAYRYIETPLSKNIETQKNENDVYSVQALDNRMVEVLKVSNKDLKEKLISYAKECAVQKNLKATICYKIEVRVVQGRPDSSGVMEVKSIVNWNYPSHEQAKEYEFSMKSELEFDDILVIRNKLALHLEEVCQLFL